LQPLEEKLGQLKVAAQGKLGSVAEETKQSLDNAQRAAKKRYAGGSLGFLLPHLSSLICSLCSSTLSLEIRGSCCKHQTRDLVFWQVLMR
jgi:hypothetical protein